MKKQKKRVAILCSGLDSVRRGYETHTRALFNELKSEQNLNQYFLFKRDGPKHKDETPLFSPYRYGFICTYLGKLRGNHLYWECTLFALYFSIRTILTFKKFDVISCIEPMTSKTIYFFRPLFRGKPIIVFTHGVSNSPEEVYPIADKIHQVNIENFNMMEEYCIQNNLQNKQILLPHFLPNLKEIEFNNTEILKKYGIPKGKILLNVGAIESIQKRTSYVFEEFASLPSSWLLLICGKIQDINLHTKYKEMYGKRYINLYLPNSEMKYIYAISSAMVQASTNEGFGIVLLEAMRQGLPCFAHDRPLFRWILKSEETLVDMNEKGALASKIIDLESNLDQIGKLQAETFYANYTWSIVKHHYKSLFT